MIESLKLTSKEPDLYIEIQELDKPIYCSKLSWFARWINKNIVPHSTPSKLDLTAKNYVDRENQTSMAQDK